MAPAATKRRRGEEEVRRPKKKIRNFKKQAEYHSSSDEDDAPASAGIAPRRPIPNATGANATKPSKTKPILKHTLPALHKAQQNGLSATNPNDRVDQAEEETSTGEKTHINTSLNRGSAQQYSSEESDRDGMEIDETARNIALNLAPAEASSSDEYEDDEPAIVGDSSADEASSASDSDTSATSSNPQATKKKRNDPTAFATSISKILDTKLSTSKRRDPVLSRSKSASEANASLANERLETKARAQIRHERKSLQEKGRVKDVLGLETPGVETGAILEEERRLKKTAQRGVVKLFNAVRAAQVKAETATREAKAQGIVGIGKREERVSEMSKQGFLDLISSGGKEKVAA